MERAKVVSGGLLEAGGSGAEALELVKEDLDEIALGIGDPIEPRLSLARGIGADDSLHAASANRATNGIGVIPSVRDHGFALRMFEERFGDGGFVLLARSDLDVERSAVRVDDRVEFRRESTT